MTHDFHQYYATLGLQPGASPADVKQAYRQLVKTWHPDRFADAPERQQQAEAKIKTINHAYAQLKDRQPTLQAYGPAAGDRYAQAEIYYQRGVEQARQERYRAALEELSQAIFLNPNYVEAYRHRGLVYSVLGRERKANADLRMVAELKRKWGKTSAYTPPPPPPASEPTPAAATGQPWICAGTLRQHTGSVTGLAVSPDGRTFASSSHDATVRLWQTSTGRPLHLFVGHSDRVYTVAISPDGRCVASGGADKAVRLWDLYTGQQLQACGAWFGGHSRSVLSVAFSRDRRKLISGGADATLRIWKARSGKEIRSITGYSGAVTAIALSPDGKTLVSGGLEKAIKIREFPSGRLLCSLREDYRVLAIAFHPDGRQFATAGSDGRLRLWDLPSERIARVYDGHDQRIAAVAFSPDGNTLASGSWDSQLKLWDVKTGAEICTLAEHSDGVLGVAFSPDGDKLFSCSADKTIKIWWPNR